jgi:hypothetical protein
LTNNLLTNKDRKLVTELGVNLSTFAGHCGVLSFLFADIAIALYKNNSNLFLNCKESLIQVLYFMLYDPTYGGLSMAFLYSIAKRFVTRSRYIRVQANKITKSKDKISKDRTNCEPCKYIVH